MKLTFETKHIRHYLTKNILGSTEIWTRIAGFKVQSANHYTMEPLHNNLFFSIQPYQTWKSILSLCLQQLQMNVSMQWHRNMSTVSPTFQKRTSLVFFALTWNCNALSKTKTIVSFIASSEPTESPYMNRFSVWMLFWDERKTNLAIFESKTCIRNYNETLSVTLLGK